MFSFNHGSKKSQPIISGKTWFPKGLIFFLVLIASGLTLVSESEGNVFKSRYRVSGVPKVIDVQESKQFAVISISSKSVRLQVGKAVDNPFGQTADTIHQESLVNPMGTKVLAGIKATSIDLADTHAVISKFKQKAIELGVTQGRMFIVVGSSLVAGWTDIQNFRKDLEIHGLPVEILTSQAEAEMSVLAICPDPKLANNILVVDVGSGSIKLTTQFVRKGFVTALNTTVLPGVSEITRKLSNDLRTLEKFENQVTSLVDANPAISNRAKVIVTGGIPYVMTLIANAEGQYWKPNTNQIVNLTEKFVTAPNFESIIGGLNDEDESHLVSNLFTLGQLKAGASVMAALNRLVFFNKEVYFCAKSSPSWEMAYGLKKLHH